MLDTRILKPSEKPTSRPLAVRVLGAVIAWLLFTTCLAFVYRGLLDVTAMGGSCASGGPYVIEHECSPFVAAMVPVGIFGMVIAIGLHALLAASWGPILFGLFWPLIFTVLGTGFLVATSRGFDPWSGVFCGVLFLVMGLAPVVLLLWSDARLTLGIVSATGASNPVVRRVDAWRVIAGLAMIVAFGVAGAWLAGVVSDAFARMG